MVVNAFERASHALVYEDAKLFKNFEQCVSGISKMMWLNVTVGIATDQHTTERFNEAIEQMIWVVVGNKDTLISHLENGIQKPCHVMLSKHMVRIQEMVRVPNKIQGTEPDINEQQEKNIIFATFPRAWHIYYRKAKGNLKTDSLAEITCYMMLLKGLEAKTRQSRNEA